MSHREVAYEYVTSSGRFAEILATYADEPRYAIDSEFLQNKSFVARLALVQIAWPSFIILVDPFSVDLGLLTDLFASEAVAILHAGSNDLPLLLEAVGSLPRFTFDTELAAQLLGLASTSLQGLAAALLDLELDKSEQVRDWTIRPIPERALDYAANDVIHLFDITDELTRDLIFCDRLEALHEECAWQLATVGHTDREMVWWKAKVLHRGTALEQMRAQYFFAARDDIASRLNVPRNAVVHQDSAIEIIQRPPATLAALVSRLGRTPAQLSSEDHQLLWAAIENSASAPADELRVPDADVADGELGLLLTLAKIYVRYTAHQWRISANFLASHRDLVKFFRHEPTRLDVPWRRSAVTDALSLLRSGSARLRVLGPELVLEAHP
ncbi:MAG: hypothetical protein WCG86_06640 [Actinomycetota bacterium]|jgi:ribonuclease D